jgi:hypothetical protein
MQEKRHREWWPIGIVIAMLTFMGGVVFAVSIMMRNDVPLTSADYYAQEIAYQSEIDKAQRGLAAAEKPVVRILEAAETLEIVFPGRKKATQFVGKATLFRPSNPSEDFAVTLNPDADGRIAIDLHTRAKGLWTLQLEWSQDNTPYYYEQALIH